MQTGGWLYPCAHGYSPRMGPGWPLAQPGLGSEFQNESHPKRRRTGAAWKTQSHRMRCLHFLAAPSRLAARGKRLYTRPARIAAPIEKRGNICYHIFVELRSENGVERRRMTEISPYYERNPIERSAISGANSRAIWTENSPNFQRNPIERMARPIPGLRSIR